MQLHQHEMSIQLRFRSLETVVNFSPFCLYEILPLKSRNCLLDSNAPKKRDTGTGKWNSVSRGQQFAIHAIPSALQWVDTVMYCHVTVHNTGLYWINQSNFKFAELKRCILKSCCTLLNAKPNTKKCNMSLCTQESVMHLLWYTNVPFKSQQW